LDGFKGYLARISQYEGAIIERDPEESGLYRSRLYEQQRGQEAIHTWVEHQYLPLLQQVALVHEATHAHYSKGLGGKESEWLHKPATEKQLQMLQRKHPQAAQKARIKKWTGQRVSDLITFLSMKEALTNPPPLPQETPNDAT
jgi:flagellar biosynthesis chaperone FliJ